ncbi:hypothetical protein DOTSEDRAFT_119794 [Dothistroma septosporum NZE10]|uniref:Integral membrane protein-like protein n=1 Tax=Dothistroma septosporum (strain NZE10 / CBS 128990) TaxID=675120 RepID=N1Q489_DOTSN|nr:hypothetical protein DOTSEDRAFT_119794 [Dothistroma septosporum NZE10]
MRLSALPPIAFIATSFVLTFLCLFAGSNKGFMEDYSVLTLNTSRIGYLEAFDSTSENPILNLIDNATQGIQNEIQDTIHSVARKLGLHDFYSVHLMAYCEGFYTPDAVPNATLKRNDINRNVTDCSNRTTVYNFDPQQILQDELDNSGHGNIDLVADLRWPKDVSKGIRALRIAARAAFVLYCIAIGFEGIGLILGMVSFFLEGRLNAFANMFVDWLAFLVLGIASAISTAIAVKGVDVINKYGDKIGIQAQRWSKFLTLTWVATGLMLLASIVWCFDCVVGSRHRRSARKYG